MSDVKRIKLYTENHVDRNYLIPCYAALCEREEPLTAEEGVDLGMLDVIQIAAAREKVRSSRLPSGARSPLSPTIHGADLHEVIRQTFHIVPLETSLLGDQTTHTNITGALVLISQLTSFRCPSNHILSFFNSGDPNHTTTDSQNPIDTETKTGDQKTNGNENGATIDTGDPSKTGGDSNSNQSHSSTPTTGKGSHNTDDSNTNAGTSKGAKGGGNNNNNSHKNKNKRS